MKKTILGELIKFYKNKNEFLVATSVWNYYGCGSYTDLIKNTKSNLHKSVKDLLEKGLTKEGITVIVGAKGRTEHSATELIVFKGEIKDINGAYFSSSEIKRLINKK